MHYKYPRTPHLTFSQGATSDDKIISNLDDLLGYEIIVTEKMDGENTSCYQDHMHARSLDSRHHPSRDWMKAFWGSFRFKLPPAPFRICGENLYARHSLAYGDLASYFLGFSIWDERNVALSWDETLKWFDDLGIIPVPVLYRGTCDLDVIRGIVAGLDLTRQEGIVMRRADEIPVLRLRVPGREVGAPGARPDRPALGACQDRSQRDQEGVTASARGHAAFRADRTFRSS